MNPIALLRLIDPRLLAAGLGLLGLAALAWAIHDAGGDSRERAIADQDRAVEDRVDRAVDAVDRCHDIGGIWDAASGRCDSP